MADMNRQIKKLENEVLTSLGVEIAKDGEILKLIEMLEKEGIPFECREMEEDYVLTGHIRTILVGYPCFGEGKKWSFFYQFAFDKQWRTSLNSIGADWGWIEIAKIDRGYVNTPFFKETAEEAFGIVRDDYYKKGKRK